MNSKKHTVGVLLAAAALGVAAQDLPLRDSAADSMTFSDKQSEEGKLQLPAAPKPEDLIRFDAGPARRGFEHFVDSAALSLGPDGIVRYTLVVKSDMGVSNVTFEGMRCVTRERKIYAHGRSDGSWRESGNAEWKTIGQAHVAGPVFVLYSDFFCPGRHAVASASEAIAALKVGHHPRSLDESSSRLTPLGR